MALRIRQDLFIIGFLALVAVASGADIFADLAGGASTGHLLREAALLLLALFILAWLLWDYRDKKRQLRTLQNTLEEIQSMPAPASPRVSSARQQLGEAIVEQFERWQLTESEREIGLMLLKGYSLKEIALLRGTAEKTIRQQASSIYQKSGVSGRHAFSAWFIEDLL